jgi:hypothetical protein
MAEAAVPPAVEALVNAAKEDPAAAQAQAAAVSEAAGAAKPAAPASKPTSRELLGAMAKSWLTQVPMGFGTGFLLAKQNIPGAFFAALLTSLFVSMDILNRMDLPKQYWPVLIGLTLTLTAVSVVPWAATRKNGVPENRKNAALPSGLAAAAGVCLLVAALGTSGGLASNGRTLPTKADSLLGVIITLMYVLISGSIGWHGAKASGTSGYASGGNGGSGTTTDAPSSQPAPAAPSNRGLHKGWAVYSVMILLLLTLFDLISQLNN